MRIGYKISWLVFGTALFGTAALTMLSYTAARRQYLAGVDRQLTTIAASIPHAVGESYLERGLAAPGSPVRSASLTAGEYDQMVRKLSDLADQAGLFYVYVFARDGDGVAHVATSASAAERTAGDWSRVFEEYRQPPPELLTTFADGVTRFAQYSDEFGSFRSIFERRTTATGKSYVVGADVALGQIHADLAAMVWRHVAVGLLVAALAATLGIAIARRIARPLLRLSQEVDAWSERDFAQDEGVRTQLQRLADRHKDESGDLAGRFVSLQNRLAGFLDRLAEATAARQKIEHQLEVARVIQEGLLPEKAPVLDNFHVSGWSQPADQTGGDYFDWLELPNGQIMLTIGDVTGHGIGPALVTAASRAYARATFNGQDALETAIARLNDLLHGDLKGERFVTMVACLLDPQSREMKLVAAGHGPVLFYSKSRDTVDVTIDTHGMPLGVIDNEVYDRPLDLHFRPGDALVLVSDGFFEWLNADGEAFGTDRLAASILASCRSAPDAILDRLRQDVADFNGGTGQADDTTALIIRCIS